MGKKALLALFAIAAFAAAVVVGMSATAALAGEVTGNCKPDTTAQAADNCKKEFSNGNSWCRYSGQNDDPTAPIDGPNGPGGTSQSYGQDVKLGLVDPSSAKGGATSPGTECNPNGDHTLVPPGPPPRK